MRPTVPFAMTLLCVASLVRAAVADSTTKPANDELTPSATPGDALLAPMLAQQTGNETAYRRVMLIRSPSGYAEAYTRWGLASARLHGAVETRGVTRERTRDAGFDRGFTLSSAIPKPAAAKALDQLRTAVGKMTWTIEGDIARPVAPANLGGGTGGPVTIERRDTGWVAVLSDPSAAPESLRQMADEWNRTTAAIDEATRRIEAGELKTIREVNDAVDAAKKASVRPKA